MLVDTVLEGDAASQLEDAVGSSAGDLSIVSGGKVGGWSVEADEVEDVGRIDPELKVDPFEDAEDTRQTHIDVPVSRCAKIVARRVAVCSSRPDTTCPAGAVGGKGCFVEPCVRCNEAWTVWIEEGVDPGNKVGTVVIVTV